MPRAKRFEAEDSLGGKRGHRRLTGPGVVAARGITSRGGHHNASAVEILLLQRTAGNAAVSTLMRDSQCRTSAPEEVSGAELIDVPARRVGRSVRLPRHTSPAWTSPVQRIMNQVEWLDCSALSSDSRGLFASKRKKILAVDNAVNDYRAAGDYSGDKPAVADAREVALTKIRAAGNVYLGLDATKAKRRGAVQLLVNQVEAELPLLRRLMAARSERGLKEKLDVFLDVQRLALEASRNGLRAEGLGTYASELVMKAAVAHDGADRATLEEIVKTDFRQLKLISDDVDTPAIVREVITEALQHIGAIHLGDFRAAGARTPNDQERQDGVTTKYVVNHKLAVPLGQEERLASLMHEMTHVVAGETYQNTMMFLLFDPRTAPSDVVTLATERKAALLELLALTRNALQAGTINTDQDALLRDKLGYGGGSATSGDKLGTYVSNFAAKLGPTELDRLRNLAQSISGFSSTVVEYDSVINQVLLLCYQWKLSSTDPLYLKVSDLATAAKRSRDTQRERMQADAMEAGKAKNLSLSGSSL